MVILSSHLTITKDCADLFPNGFGCRNNLLKAFMADIYRTGCGRMVLQCTSSVVPKYLKLILGGVVTTLGSLSGFASLAFVPSPVCRR